MSFSSAKDSERREFLILLGIGGGIGSIGGGIAFATLNVLAAPTFGFFTFLSQAFLQIQEPVLGFIVHMLIALLFGLLFGSILILFPRLGATQLSTILTGFVWVTFLWIFAAYFLGSIIGGLTFAGAIPPIEQLLGGFFEIETYTSESRLRSYASHLVYGITLSLATWHLPKLLE